MSTLLTTIQLTAESTHIPPQCSKSWPILIELIRGCKRKKLRAINESYHGSPLEDLEGEKFGFWLIDRYTDDDGESCLKLNDRHLVGSQKQDSEARKIRRNQRAEISLKQAQREKERIPKALAELNEAQMEYLLSLGEAANDAEIKKPQLK
ncbi:hypothetical protein tloyanaT_20020 [Thalassotalea loyana]|uniref:Uncharacterized protein n=1 Tax=Thalassotalea loyana TaxID=280483 RepID=A0ABQ6HG84_9GAMM|nr:hypothetical protein [Thalassotalea loyana]GLX85750.1 hypothetical protein tloyanaT_20020 [Thalassotalea loyana]